MKYVNGRCVLDEEERAIWAELMEGVRAAARFLDNDAGQRPLATTLHNVADGVHEPAL